MAVVWVTRTSDGAARTAKAVEAMGHEPIVAPVLAVQPVAADLTVDFDTVIFTSRNGVERFATQDARRPAAWCVGDATAEAARAHGFSPVISAGGDAHALFETIRREAGPETRFLYAASREPSAPLTGWMRAQNLIVTEVAVYEVASVAPNLSDDDLGRLTHILIHSARAGRALAQVLRDNRKFAFTNLCFICISEQAWQGFANAFDTDLVPRIKRRVAAHPDDAAMLKLIGADAEI